VTPDDSGEVFPRTKLSWPEGRVRHRLQTDVHRLDRRVDVVKAGGSEVKTQVATCLLLQDGGSRVGGWHGFGQALLMAAGHFE